MSKPEPAPRVEPSPNVGRRIIAYPPESNGQPWLAIITHEYGLETGYLECVAFPPGKRMVTLQLDATAYVPME